MVVRIICRLKAVSEKFPRKCIFKNSSNIITNIFPFFIEHGHPIFIILIKNQSLTSIINADNRFIHIIFYQKFIPSASILTVQCPQLVHHVMWSLVPMKRSIRFKILHFIQQPHLLFIKL